MNYITFFGVKFLLFWVKIIFFVIFDYRDLSENDLNFRGQIDFSGIFDTYAQIFSAGENYLPGLNRAGCADCVGFPSGATPLRV